MSLPPGLPPLPKSLSAAAAAVDMSDSMLSSLTLSQKPCVLEQQQQLHQYGNSVAAVCTNSNTLNSINTTSSQRHSHRQGSLSSTQDSTSDRDSLHSRASSSMSTTHDAPTSTTTLDSQIAILRREMYSLRQLDLSLLSQLWALNESIQGFRSFLQEREDCSPSPTPSNTNSMSSDEPDDESFSTLPLAPPLTQALNAVVGGSGGGGSGSSASQASTSTSASNSLSANANHQQHLQQHLHHQLQQPPPPPPPAHKHSAAARTLSQQSAGRSQSLNAGNAAAARSHSQHSVGRAQAQQQQHAQQHAQQYSQQQHPQQHLQQQQQRAHPQLPPILQQRMRRPPPPPPPARGRSPSHTPDQLQQRTA